MTVFGFFGALEVCGFGWSFGGPGSLEVGFVDEDSGWIMVEDFGWIIVEDFGWIIVEDVGWIMVEDSGWISGEPGSSENRSSGVGGKSG